MARRGTSKGNKKATVKTKTEVTQVMTFTFEELFGGVPTGLGSPEKQVAVDLYNSEKRKIGKMASIEGLAVISLTVAAAVAYWLQQGLGMPLLVEILSDDADPTKQTRQYITVLFPNARVPWKGQIDGRTRPYYVPGDPDFQFKAAGEIPRLVKELQPSLDEVKLQDLMAGVLDSA